MSNKKVVKPVNPVLKTVQLDEINLKVTSATNQILVDESGNTVMCILVQNDGKVMTSFMGDYNKNILTTLEKVLKTYFKNIKKQLLHPQAKSKPRTVKSKKTEVKADNKLDKSGKTDNK